MGAGAGQLILRAVHNVDWGTELTKTLGKFARGDPPASRKARADANRRAHKRARVVVSLLRARYGAYLFLR